MKNKIAVALLAIPLFLAGVNLGSTAVAGAQLTGHVGLQIPLGGNVQVDCADPSGEITFVAYGDGVQVDCQLPASTPTPTPYVDDVK